MTTLLDSAGRELAYYCDACESREEPGDLDAYGCCPTCQLQRHLDDGDWAAAREVCDAYGMETPDALGLRELDGEITARQVADYVHMSTVSANV